MKAVLPLLLLLAACTTPTQTQTSGSPQARQCFRPGEVTGFRAVDRNTVIVSVGRDRFRLDLMGPCPQVNWSERIAIRSRTSRVCTGLDATVIAPTSTGPQRCPVRNVTLITPEEAAASGA